jgi:excisionase family DNA binding protein
MSDDRLLKVSEVAQRLGLQVCTIRRWLLLRRIESIHVGRAVRIRESEVRRLILQGTTPAREVAR